MQRVSQSAPAAPGAPARTDFAARDAPPAAAVDRLSTNLLARIFTLVPIVPRLRVVSRVSKRWRSAALQSVTSFAVARSADMDADHARLYALLPALRDLRLPSWTFTMPLPLPEALTSLRLAHDHHLAADVTVPLHLEGLTLSCRFRAPLPALQRLVLDAYIADAFAAPLVQAVAPSLTDLRIDSHKFSPPLLAALQSCPMPALTALDVRERWPVATTGEQLARTAPPFGAFVAAVCTRLTRLSFSTYALCTADAELSGFLNAVASHAYPRLECLRLRAPASAAQLTALLSHSSLLKSVALAVPLPELVAVQPALLARVTAFKLRPFIPDTGTYHMVRSLVRRAPRMRLSNLGFAAECGALARFAERGCAHAVCDVILTNVTLDAPALFALLARLPNLEHLQINDLGSDGSIERLASPKDLALASLRRLELHSVGTLTWAAIAAYLRLFLEVSPKLTAIGFGFPSRALKANMLSLRALLEAMERRGVSEVRVATNYPRQLLRPAHEWAERCGWLSVAVESGGAVAAAEEEARLELPHQRPAWPRRAAAWMRSAFSRAVRNATGGTSDDEAEAEAEAAKAKAKKEESEDDETEEESDESRGRSDSESDE